MNYIPWIWLGLFVVLAVIEAATQGLTTIWGAISALVMVVLSFIKGFPLVWQIIVFLLMTAVLLATTRPFFMKRLKIGKYATNVNLILGQEVVVVKAIEKFQKGEAKAKNGVVWAATSDNGSAIPVDSVCEVSGVDGNTLRLRVIDR